MNAGEVVNSTPFGGTPYEDVAAGKVKGATMSFIQLGYGDASNFTDHVTNVVSHIEHVITDIEEKSLRSVEEYCIGKTTCREAMKYKGRVNAQNCVLPKRLKEFTRRWSSKYEKEGYNGLIGVCCVVREHVPKKPETNEPIYNQEEYALALEAQAIMNLQLVKKDGRVNNVGYKAGGKTTRPAVAGIVYVAFKLEKTKEEAEEEDHHI